MVGVGVGGALLVIGMILAASGRKEGAADREKGGA
jgi:hypothetical protein